MLQPIINDLPIQKPIIFQDGVYDISIEDYHAGPGISRSTLMEFTKSPLHFNYKLHNKEVKEKIEIIRKFNPLEFGNALHTMVLEQDKFNDRYIVMPKVNRVTKAGKLAYETFLNQAKGREIICSEAYKELAAMRASISAHPDAQALISDAEYERSLYWTDPDTDLLCKVRPDIWHENFVVDLKTTASASLRDFTKSVYSYGYHIQAAMIHEAIKYVRSEIVTTFIFVAIEKEAPYAVAVYQLDENALQHGIQQFKEMLRGIRQCMDSNTWSSYTSGLITVPAWASR